MSQGQFRAAPFLVVFDGQSLNLLPGPLDNGYPVTTMASYPGVAWTSEPAKGATSWTTLSLTQTERSNALANAAAYTILVMCGGTTDIETENDSGATLYANEETYADAARAAGFDYIIGSTTTKTTGMTGGQLSALATGNGLIIADAGDAFDAVVDFDGNASLDDPADVTYYSDGTHWTAAGCAVAASLVVAALAVPL